MRISVNNLIVIFVAIYPIIPYYFEIAGINATNIFSLIWGLGGFVLLRKRAAIAKLRGRKYVIAIILWIVAYDISIFINGAISEGLLFTLRVSVVFFIFTKLINSKERFLLAVKTIVNVSGIVAIFGLVEEITHFNVFQLLNTAAILNYNPLRFGILRILSFTSQTITYGLYTMFCMALCVYLLITSGRDKKRKYYIIYALLWINLMLTLSRSVIICAVISQIIILYLCGFRVFLKRLCLIVLSVAILLFFVGIIFPNLAGMISNYVYMIIAVFDSSYQSQIAGAFGTDNIGAIGNRTDLYGWVADSMDDNWIFGHGARSQFAYTFQKSDGRFTWDQTKTSIEVQYLAVLYRYGILGLVSEVWMYLTILVTSFMQKGKSAAWEARIGFNGICFAMFFMYFAALFAVNASSEQPLFLVILGLFISYNLNDKFQNYDNR